MNVVVCLDDIGGMTFNNRRLSRDQILVENVIETVGSNRLLMSEYSAPLFEEYTDINVVVNESYLSDAGAGDYCFVEREALSNYVDQIETVILYKWNRRYPATKFFDVPLDDWTQCECVDFVGSSHEKITKERYIK